VTAKTKIVYESLLWPRFEKYVSDPLFKFIPWGVPANMMTLIGNLCMFLATLAAYYASRGGGGGRSHPFNYWQLIPLLICIYFIGDLLDGKQARRTGTCSVLGEFLDHFFDILVMGQVLAMLFFAYQMNSPLITGAVICIGYFPLFGSYYEQYYTNTLYFEKISSFESILFSTALCCLGFVDGARTFLKQKLFLNLSIIDMAILIAVITAIVLGVRNLLRAGNLGRKRYYVFFPLVVLTLFFSAHYFTAYSIIFIMTFYCGSYVQRFMLAYVKEEKEPAPDFVFPILLGAALFLKLPREMVVPVGIGYQCACMFLVFLSGFVSFKDGWVWINPTRQKYGIKA
jgi:ethanolaminephosphotransferase